MILKKLKIFWLLLKRTVIHFFDENYWPNAAALSYYTIFALPPMLLIILRSTSLLYNRDVIESTLFSFIRNYIGKASTTELSHTLDQIGLFQDEWWATTIGIIGLFITSTTVFITIQGSLNRIFRVKARPKHGIWKLVRDRLLSFAFLLSLGFVLLVSLLINAGLAAAGKYLSSLIPGISTLLLSVASIVVPFLIIALLFGAIFKLLPDADLRWREVRTGAIITTILFSLGKNLIGLYVGSSRAVNLYDAAGEVMVIMLWVFYAAVIFLFGAVFVRNYAEYYGNGIRPSEYAVRIEIKEEEIETHH